MSFDKNQLKIKSSLQKLNQNYQKKKKKEKREKKRNKEYFNIFVILKFIP